MTRLADDKVVRRMVRPNAFVAITFALAQNKSCVVAIVVPNCSRSFTEREGGSVSTEVKVIAVTLMIEQEKRYSIAITLANHHHIFTLLYECF